MSKIKLYCAWPKLLDIHIFDNKDMRNDTNHISDIELNKDILNQYEDLEVLLFNEEVINPNENNFLLVHWLNLRVIINPDQSYDYNLSNDMINLLKKYNMKLILGVPRENVLWQGLEERYKKENLHAIDADAYNFYKNMKRQDLLMLQCGFKSPYNIKDKAVIHLDWIPIIGAFPGFTKTKHITSFGSKHFVIPYQKKYFDETVNQKKYKFISLLGDIERPHRVAFLMHIYKDGLLNKDDLCVSWVYTRKTDDYDKKIELTKRNHPKIIPNLNERAHKKFISLVAKSNILEPDIQTFLTTKRNENKNDSAKNPLYSNILEWMSPLQVTQSLMQIVYETRPHAPFLTEKFYKPILSKQPFIWYSIDKVLDFLEEENYKTYSFINYKYDSISNRNERWKEVYKEFKRLYSIPFEDLKEMIQKENHISEHNYEVFLNNFKKDTQGKRLYEQLRAFI